MTLKSRLFLSAAAIGMAIAVAAPCPQSHAQQTASVTVGDSDLGGVVRGPGGPEAGVWVIAETTDLPTKFAKIVVTDSAGRYLLPELPKAKYKVWVRGYGLVDSPKIDSEPGRLLDLDAVAAPNEAAAAEYYPAIYWYSMLQVPDKSLFPGTGPQGNGMPTGLRSQGQWLDVVKTNGCYTCHQLGNKATRTLPKDFADMKPEEAWMRRIMSGQAQLQMATAMGRLDVPRAVKLFADWTERVGGGELPATQADATAGHRAQCGDLAVGLVEPKGLSARRDRHRQAQAHGQSVRQDLRLDRGEHRLLPGARSEDAHRDRGEDAGARCQYAVLQEQRDGAVALLGR